MHHPTDVHKCKRILKIGYMLIVYLKIAKMVNNSNISNHKIKSIAPPTIKLPRRVCDELCIAYALPILRHN